MVSNTGDQLSLMQSRLYTWESIQTDLVDLVKPLLEAEVRRIDAMTVSADEQVRLNKSEKRGIYINLIKDLLFRNWYWIAYNDVLYCFMGNIYEPVTRTQFIMLTEVLWAVWQRDYEVKDNTEIYKILVGKVTKPINQIDAHPNLLPFQNGVVWLDTGALTQYDPQLHFFTRCIPWDYDEKAECPRFKQALHDMLPDPIMRDRLLHYLAYCLTPRIDLQFGQIWIGPQGCGKSNLQEAFIGMLGPMAFRISLEDVATDKHARYEVRGRRVIWGSELGGFKLSKAQLNKLKTIITDGIMDGRQLFHDPINFINTAKFLYSTNDTPIPQSPDDAFWIRWEFIIFAKIYRGTAGCVKDFFTGVIFPAERQGIIKYLISLLPAVNKVLTTPRPEETKRIWMSRSSNALEFIDAECDITDVAAMIPCTDLHGLYVTWCQKEHKDAMVMTTFKRYMGFLGYAVVTAVSESGNFREHFKGIKSSAGQDPMKKDLEKLLTGAPEGSLGILGDNAFMDKLDRDYKEDEQ